MILVHKGWQHKYYQNQHIKHSYYIKFCFTPFLLHPSFQLHHFIRKTNTPIRTNMPCPMLINTRSCIHLVYPSSLHQPCQLHLLLLLQLGLQLLHWNLIPFLPPFFGNYHTTWKTCKHLEPMKTTIPNKINYAFWNSNHLIWNQIKRIHLHIVHSSRIWKTPDHLASRICTPLLHSHILGTSQEKVHWDQEENERVGAQDYERNYLGTCPRYLKQFFSLMPATSFGAWGWTAALCVNSSSTCQLASTSRTKDARHGGGALQRQGERERGDRAHTANTRAGSTPSRFQDPTVGAIPSGQLA